MKFYDTDMIFTVTPLCHLILYVRSVLSGEVLYALPIRIRSKCIRQTLHYSTPETNGALQILSVTQIQSLSGAGKVITRE